MNYNKENITDKRNRLRSKGSQRRHSVFLFLLKFILLICIAGIVCVSGIVIGSVNGIISITPSDPDLKPKNMASTIYDDQENIVQYLSDYESNRIPVTSEQIPDNLKNAFVAIEDERFYQHSGIDAKGIARAIINDLIHGNTSQGASTITQQLIKNNVFNVGGEKNVFAKMKRKVQEQYLALEAEKNHDKDFILTNYLNTINLGKGTLGVEAAAKYYFGKKSSDLSLSECAVLAGITKNPAYLNPIDYPDDNNERRVTILEKMLKLGFIGTEDYQTALADESVYARITDNVSNNKNHLIYSYFTDAVILKIVNDLQEKAGYTQSQAYDMVYRGGLKIYSTQNTQMQNIADSIVNDPHNYPVDTKYSLEFSMEVKHEDGSTTNYTTNTLRKYFAKKTKNSKYKTIYSSKKKMDQAVAAYKKAIVKDTDTILSEHTQYALQPQVSYSLIDHTTGEIKVLIGGRGKKQDDLSLNRAISVTRQPGSTFKILSTYAPGIDNGGMTLGTVFEDAPFSYEGGGSIHNAEKKYYGLMTVRDAIIESDNIVAVKALTSLTPQVGFNYLQHLGFTTLVQNRSSSSGSMESDVNQSLALGGITDGVTNVELTAAYASIANKGEYNTPVLYTKVTDNDGNVLLENPPAPARVMKDSTAWLLTSAMQDVIKKGTGKEAKLKSKMAVAGKTGTTSNNYDYWFCGYTPYYTASIWSGYDYNTDFGTSCDYHKEIWAKIMDKIIVDTKQKVKSFDSCKSIVKAKICIKSGKLPIDKVCSHDPQKSMVREEFFEKGTVPKDSCDSHIVLSICKDSKKFATQYCPKESEIKRIYRKRPAGSTGITDDSNYVLKYDPKSTRNQCNIHTKKWQEEQKKLEEEKKLLEEQQKLGIINPLDPTKPVVPTTAAPPAQTTTAKKSSTSTSKKKKH